MIAPVRHLCWRVRAWRGLVLCWFACWRSVAGVLVCASVLLATAALVWCATGCIGTSEARATANAAAVVANEARPILVAAWEAEGDRCIDTNAFQADADECLAEVDRVWLPIFDAFESFRAAHSLYRAAIEAGGMPGIADLRDAYCVLRDLAAMRYQMIDFPGAPCAEVTP